MNMQGGALSVVFALWPLPLLACTATATAAGSPAVSAQGGHVLARAVVPGLDRAARLGPLAPTQRLQVAVVLHDPNAAAEAAAAGAVYDRGSAAYHRYWTPARWQARFSLPRASLDRVVHSLMTYGLSPAYVAPTRRQVAFNGTAAQVERAFDVALERFRTAGGETFFANLGPPTVPAGVDAVIGLEDLSDRLPGDRAAGVELPCVANTCLGLLTPQELWSIYDLPGSNLGTGQKVAVIGEGDMSGAVSDLRDWENRFALPQVAVREVAVADDQSDTSNQLEWDLDTQASTGMAPDALELDLYFSQSLPMVSNAFAAWVNDAGGALQADASFGGCESVDLALGVVQAEASWFTQAKAEGRTLFASSGDNGGACTPGGLNGASNAVVPQVDWPASSSDVVSVGGTELFTTPGGTPNRALETAWTFSGGGFSLLNAAPGWQTADIPFLRAPCVTDDTAAPHPATCRGVPDVAAMSGDVPNGQLDVSYDGFDITSHGSDGVDGGTSLSAPLWAGIWTRIQAASSLAGGLGFAAPALYGDDATYGAGDFQDISAGSNGQCPALPRVAVVDPLGWDCVTGLGTPASVTSMMLHLAGSTSPSNPGAPVGGGGVTAGSQDCAPGSNGTLYAPGGNQPTAMEAADVTEVVPSYANGAITVAWTAPHLASAQGALEVDFYWTFGFGGSTYRFDAGYDPVLGDRFPVFEGAGFNYYLNPQVGGATTVGTGNFDFVHGTVTMSMTLAQFNAATGLDMHPSPNPSVLTPTSAGSGWEYTGGPLMLENPGPVFVLESPIDNGSCAFTLS
jgi:hypothetical protein